MYNFFFDLVPDAVRNFTEQELGVLRESLEDFYCATFEDDFDFVQCLIENIRQELVEPSTRDIRQRFLQSQTRLVVTYDLVTNYVLQEGQTPAVDINTLATEAFADDSSTSEFIELFQEQAEALLGTSSINNIEGGLEVVYVPPSTDPPTAAPAGTDTSTDTSFGGILSSILDFFGDLGFR